MQERLGSLVPSGVGCSRGVATQLGTPGGDNEDTQAAVNSYH